MHLIQEPQLAQLDSVKRSISRVFWGNTKDAEGNVIETQSETRNRIEKRLSEHEFNDEIKRRTVTLVFNFSGVTIDSLLKRETTSTTVYKQWYNNEGVAQWTEQEVEAFLAETKGKIEISVKDVISTVRRGLSPEDRLEKAVKKFFAAGMTKKEMLEAIEKLG